MSSKTRLRGNPELWLRRLYFRSRSRIKRNEFKEGPTDHAQGLWQAEGILHLGDWDAGLYCVCGT